MFFEHAQFPTGGSLRRDCGSPGEPEFPSTREKGRELLRLSRFFRKTVSKASAYSATYGMNSLRKQRREFFRQRREFFRVSRERAGNSAQNRSTIQDASDDAKRLHSIE